MTSIEIKFLVWACLTLLAILAFVGVVFVNYFMQMAKDVSAIKTALQVHGAKHEGLEKRVEHIETKLEIA